MREYGLIGNSLLHSRSGKYFLQKFTRDHITDCIYENYQFDDLTGVRQVILDRPYFVGFNVTSPFKVEIMKYLDDMDPVAEAIGAVNCVKISRSRNIIKLTGFNTDARAFRESLKPLLGSDHSKALVLGTGGAARAVCHALKELLIDYSMVSRKAKQAVITYPDITGKTVADHKLIVNATPVGIFPDENEYPPLPYKYLTCKHLLYDLIYNPEETVFLKNGREAGAQVKNWLEMLELQAELSWEIWNS